MRDAEPDVSPAQLLAALPQGHVVGIDLSQNMLHSAREHLAECGARLSLAACDLLHLPFKGVFDGIVSTAAFHWVLDHDRLFLNLRTRAQFPVDGWKRSAAQPATSSACVSERIPCWRDQSSRRFSQVFASRGFIRTQSPPRKGCGAPALSMSRPQSSQRPRCSTVPSSTKSSFAILFCGNTCRRFPPKAAARILWNC